MSRAESVKSSEAVNWAEADRDSNGKIAAIVVKRLGFIGGLSAKDHSRQATLIGPFEEILVILLPSPIREDFGVLSNSFHPTRRFPIRVGG